jgi:N-acetylglucosaminyldiphosphoundecaprenol N-acetyl-beta-D-mannosaminyltransferase
MSDAKVNSTLSVEGGPSSRRSRYDVIGTRLLATDYDSLIDDLLLSWRKREPRTLSFCNTFMVTKRRHEPGYRSMTEVSDTNLPDGMPLVWCMNLKGAGMRDRVYGPVFMERFLERSPAEIRHYFLGGNAECLRRLCENVKALNPNFQLVGAHHGYFNADDESRILSDLFAKEPDIVWVGLGTPKQDEWVARNRVYFERAILLPVGSSFEFLAGTKAAPPQFFQRLGMTWFFRMCAEPRRLIPRYAKYNGLFLYYLFCDSFFQARSPQPGRENPGAESLNADRKPLK